MRTVSVVGAVVLIRAVVWLGMQMADADFRDAAAAGQAAARDNARHPGRTAADVGAAGYVPQWNGVHMKHAEKRMAGRYVEAFSWHRSIRAFLEEIVTERPILNVCSGPEDFGDVHVDRYIKPIPPGVRADWTALPFRADSFASVFADPPWNLAHMKACADFCKEALRVAPVAYVMSPWLWVNKTARRTRIWAREFPGVNIPILIVRYERCI